MLQIVLISRGRTGKKRRLSGRISDWSNASVEKNGNLFIAGTHLLFIDNVLNDSEYYYENKLMKTIWRLYVAGKSFCWE